MNYEWKKIRALLWFSPCLSFRLYLEGETLPSCILLFLFLGERTDKTHVYFFKRLYFFILERKRVHGGRAEGEGES